VQIALPQEAFVYDVRNGRLLGKEGKIQTTLTPGDPRILALLPYEAGPLEIRPISPTFRPGDTARFEVSLPGTGAAGGRHCLRVQAVWPDGTSRPWHRQNVLTASSKTLVSIGLAVNAPAGEWQLRACDVATGQTATARFQVNRP
jgi:hypothetical protein